MLCLVALRNITLNPTYTCGYEVARSINARLIDEHVIEVTVLFNFFERETCQRLVWFSSAVLRSALAHRKPIKSGQCSYFIWLCLSCFSLL